MNHDPGVDSLFSIAANPFFRPLLFLLFSGAAVFFGFFYYNAEDTRTYYAISGFYFIFASFLLWFFSLGKSWPGARRAWDMIRANDLPLGLALALTIGMFLSSPPIYRILMDEVDLMGMAFAMFERREVWVPMDGYFISNYYFDMDLALDKRPMAFPFLVYITHVLTGYSGSNGFIVNFAAGFGALYTFYLLLARWFPKAYAYAGMVMLAAYPMIVLWVTSSGFEITNLFFILLSFFFLARYLDQRTAYNAERLLLTLVLTSQCRYESSLFMIIFLPVVCLTLPRKEYCRLSWTVLTFPLLLIPLAWLRVVMLDPGQHQLGAGQVMFSLGNLLRNSGYAWQSLLGAQKHFATMAPVGFLALGGVLAGAYKLYQSQFWKTRNHVCLVSVFLLSFLCYYLLQFSYAHTNVIANITMRLAIPFLPVVVLLALCAARFLIRNRPGGVHVLFIFVLGLVLFHWPIAYQNQSVTTLNTHRKYNTMQKLLKERYPDKRVFVIGERGQMYINLRYGGGNVPYANANFAKIMSLLTKHIVKDVLVVQEVDILTNQPTIEYALQEYPPLEPIFNDFLDGRKYLRVSRIVLPQ